jgi:2-methylcitrate dehydratase PrpD
MMAAAWTSGRDVPLARQLARSALAVTLADLSDEAIAKAKECLLDFLACAFEARNLPWSRQAVATVRPLAAGASIIASGIEASPADAAFANATLGHGLVREDMHAGSICHHGVVIWPTLLALAQCTPSPGAALLVAAVVGYEAGGRIGRALMTATLARLYRPTGLVGPLGAALAGASLLRLDEGAAAAAFSIAANTSGGLNQWPHTGGSEMYFHPGFAARNAVAAVELAEFGAYASESIIEGEAGLFAAFRREPAPKSIALFADGRPEILSVYCKPVPACNFAQTACQAAARLAARLSDDLGDVRTVLVRLPAAAIRYPGCDLLGPFQRALQAKMSIPFGVAAALCRGAICEENYADLGDTGTLRLISLTRLEEDDTFTQRFPAAQGAEVRVSLADGSLVMERLDDVMAANGAEIRCRFRAAAAAVLGAARAAEIEACVDGLEDEDDASRVAALCTTSSCEAAVGPRRAQSQAGRRSAP